MNSDAELLRRFALQQDEDAFTALVHRHIGLVHATALRRVNGDIHLAQDVTQAVFVALARKAQAVSGHATLPGWLYVCTQQAAAETVRREQRRKRREAAAHSMQTADDSPDPAADLGRLRPLLDDAILSLKPDEREAVVQRFFAQRTFAEVGASLSITEEAARKRVDRAVEKLHAVLSRRGLTSTVAALGGALTAAGAGSVPATLATQVAGTALATGAMATGATVLAAWWPTAVAAALVMTGSFVAVSQYQRNEATAAAIAGLEAQTQLIPSQRTENDRLAREIAAAERDAAFAATVAPVLPAVPAPAQPPLLPGQRAVGKSVVVTPEGTIQWDGDLVRLEEFLVMLKAHQVATGGASKVIVRAEGAKFPQLLYVLEESRKIGIKHLVIESDAAPASSWRGTWF
ncbi:MAG TPA: sigma-70 family RNA polymerase sigma factor [Lacunisphaera sp.]|nr:sigma-70 family RNA polymerase sigma factor [Lacunisphaera sp.]